MTITLKSLLPRIVWRYDRDKPWLDWLCGTALFADVSGFTSMAEALSVLDAEGAEILTENLNRYFSGMVRIINDYQGDIMKFGGDAILCFFEGEQSMPAALSAAWNMQQTMVKFRIIKTPVGNFPFSMKIGLGFGTVMLAGLGDPDERCDFAFAGEAVDAAMESEHRCRSGEIVGRRPSSGPFDELASSSLIDDTYVRIGTMSPIPVPSPIVTTTPGVDKGSPYIIREVYQLVQRGHDRHIATLQTAIPAFVQFTGFTYTREGLDLAMLQDFFTTVVRTTHTFGGRLNRISMGDKGSTFLVLFGSPVFLERGEVMAGSWACELRDTVKRDFPSVTIKIGLNSGRLFAGLVGGHDRHDYTVMGDVVNLSARLMQAAQPFQVLIGQTLRDRINRSFQIEYVGARTFKGKKGKLPTYSLIGRKADLTYSCENITMIGRSGEIAEIERVIANAGQGRPSFVHIKGPAGIGKTTLARTVVSRATASGWLVMAGQGDPALRNHPYSPWLTCFHALFSIDQVVTLDSIRLTLQSIGPLSRDAAPLLANLFQLRHEEVTSKLDEESRKIMLHHVLSLVMLDYATREKLFIFFDDLQWFDALSLELLDALMSRSEHQPLVILGTSRLEENHGLPMYRPNTLSLELGEFDLSLTREYARMRLDGDVREELVLYLYRESGGNPFFLSTLLDYLVHNGILETRLGIWSMRQDALPQHSLSSEEIIISNVDRLEIRDKIHLRYAACAGISFPLELITQAMGQAFDAAAFECLCRRNFIIKADDGHCSFKNALIQTTLYRSIPAKLRTTLHRRLGQAIEKLFAAQIDRWYPELAEHFFIVHDRRKAREYSINAARHLREQSLAREAEKFYQQAFRCLSHTTDPRKWDIALELAEILQTIGRPDESLALCRQLRQRTLRHSTPENYIRTCLLQFRVMERLSKFSYVPFARRLQRDQRLSSVPSRTVIAYYIGLVYYRIGRLDQAEQELARFLEHCHDQAPITLQLSTYTFLAAIHRRRGHFELATTKIESAISIAEHHHMNYQLLGLLLEKGNILWEARRFEESSNIYHHVMVQSENFGDSYMSGQALLALGNTEIDLDNRKLATLYLHEALSIFNRIGTVNGIAHVHNHLGTIAYIEQDFLMAYHYYLEAVTVLKKAGELGEIATIYHNLAEVCLELERYTEARRWLDDFYREAVKIKDPHLLEAYTVLKSKLHDLS